MFEKLYLNIKKVYRRVAVKILNKINYHHHKLPKTAHYFEGSLYDAVYNTSLKYPYNVAIEYNDLQITYKQFIKRINKCARALKALGVKKEDKVTICMPNTPEEVTMFYAINEIGAVANMIHPLSSERDIEYYLNKSETKVMLCIDIDYSKVKNIINNTSVKTVIVASATKSMERITKIIYWFLKGRKLHIKEDKKFILWDHFIEKANEFQDDPYEAVEGQKPAVILYSGGTTGKSKGVVISNYSFNAQALQSVYVDSILKDTQNAFLTFLPNFHAFGIGICTHIPLFHGLRVVLIPQFNAKKIKHYIRKHKFNILCGVPTFYEYMTHVKFRKNELKVLKLVVCGGDALSLDLKKNVNAMLEKYGSSAEIQVGYGLTEVSGVVSFSPKGLKNQSDVIGYPFPDVAIKVVDPNTLEEIGINEDGELLISGPNNMLGYLNEPEETASTLINLNNKTWVRTGDICFIDNKGLIHYKSRLKRMIITNGYNVYPSHVEEVLMEIPSVKACSVIGKPDKTHGEKVIAFVVLNEGFNNIVEKGKIQKYLKDHLAKYEVPKDIKYIEELPKTLVGKVAYKELEKMC